MKLTVLGCQGPYPGPGGACSGYLVEVGGKHILMEAGSGTLARLGTIIPPESLDAVILSHLHFDHMGEMPLLGYALQSSEKRLPVYLPGEPAAIHDLLAGFGAFRCHAVQPGDTVGLDGVTVTFLPARHPVPAVGVRIACGGKTLCYTGDTNDFPGMAGCYADADLLLIDGGLPTAAWAEGKPHLSAAMAARVALDARPGQAILTHFAPGLETRLTQEARAVNPAMETAGPMRSYER